MRMIIEIPKDFPAQPPEKGIEPGDERRFFLGFRDYKKSDYIRSYSDEHEPLCLIPEGCVRFEE